MGLAGPMASRSMAVFTARELSLLPRPAIGAARRSRWRYRFRVVAVAPQVPVHAPPRGREGDARCHATGSGTAPAIVDNQQRTNARVRLTLRRVKWSAARWRVTRICCGRAWEQEWSFGPLLLDARSALA